LLSSVLAAGPAVSSQAVYCTPATQACTANFLSFQPASLTPSAPTSSHSQWMTARDIHKNQKVVKDNSLSFKKRKGRVFCLNYVCTSGQWFSSHIGYLNHDRILWNCPGNLHMPRHLTNLKCLISGLAQWDNNICLYFKLEFIFMLKCFKFVRGLIGAVAA
uniref:Uncharacterized protein n=1 Tax=Sus scrofa TaxID=9823 RepID=A0A8D2AFG6_PIG